MTSRGSALVVLAAFAIFAAACSAAIDTASIENARTAARVKSAIVNDPEIGVHPIQVRVSNQVASLSGYVPDEQAEARAIEVARSVPGIGDARSELRVGGQPPPVVPAAAEPSSPVMVVQRDEALGGAADRRLLAVGATLGWNGPGAGTLDPSESLGPLVRIGGGRGLGLAVGFGWFGSDLTPGGQSDEIIGRVRIKPIMGGLGYTVRNDRASMTISGVAGVAFNSVVPGEIVTGGAVPLDLTNSLAWRPAVSFWFDASGRVAVNVSAGYVMTRPRLSVLDDGEVVRRRLDADTFLLRVGMAYKVF